MNAPLTGPTLSALRARIEAELGDFHAPMTARVLTELTIAVCVDVAGMALFLGGEGWAVKTLGVLLAGLAHMTIGTIGHTASHGAAMSSRSANRAVTYISYPLALNLSATMWWRRHCTLHHRAPNVVGVDTDIEFNPLFIIREEEAAQGGPLTRLWWRAQIITLPLALAANAMSQIRQGWAFIFDALRDAKRRRPQHWIDLGCMTAHWGIWVVIPALFFPLKAVLLFYFLRKIIVGYMMFAVLAPGHLPSRAPLLGREMPELDWMVRQIITTVDLRVGWLGSFLCAGLQHQVAHHLFPAVPHPRYARITAIVEAFCEEHGLPYNRVGWGRGVMEAWWAFARPRATCMTPEDALAWAAGDGSPSR